MIPFVSSHSCLRSRSRDRIDRDRDRDRERGSEVERRRDSSSDRRAAEAPVVKQEDEEDQEQQQPPAAATNGNAKTEVGPRMFVTLSSKLKHGHQSICSKATSPGSPWVTL